MSVAIKGQYVEVEVLVLHPEQRSRKLPQDTQLLPYLARVKGILQTDKVALGQTAKVLSAIHRVIEGKLTAVNPPYGHDFGAPVLELLPIGNELKEIITKSWMGMD